MTSELSERDMELRRLLVATADAPVVGRRRRGLFVAALVGTLLGYGVPYLHFHGHDLGKLSGGGMTLQLIPAVGGAGVLGTF